MTQPQDREAVAAEAENMRQAEQAMAEQQRRQAEERGADTRKRQAQQEQEIDPNSPAGRQNALGRGEPVQLQGQEGDQGYVKGTNPSMTSNETPAEPNTVRGGQMRNPVLASPDVEPSPQERAAENTGQAGEVVTEPADVSGDPNAGVPDEGAASSLSQDTSTPAGEEDQSPEAVQERNQRRAAEGDASFSPGTDG